MDRYRCQNCGFAAPVGAECPRCEGMTALAGQYAAPDPRNGWVKNFSAGLNYFLSGFKFMSAHPEMWKYLIIPLIICIIIFGGMVWGGVLLIDPMLTFLDKEWVSFLEWLRVAVYWIAYVMLVLLAIALSFFLSLLVSTIVNSPFYDLLSERVEEEFLGKKFDEKWDWEYIKRMIIIPIKESAKLALFQGVIMFFLFIFSLFSAGLGTVLFAVAGAYFGALTIFDFIMARKYYALVEKRTYMKTHLAFMMGFGTPVYLVPFLTPFAVVGATLGFLASNNK